MTHTYGHSVYVYIIYIYIYIYICVCVYISHTYICIYITYINTYMIRTYVHTFIHAYTGTKASMGSLRHISLLYIHTYAHKYIHTHPYGHSAYVYNTYTHTHIHTYTGTKASMGSLRHLHNRLLLIFMAITPIIIPRWMVGANHTSMHTCIGMCTLRYRRSQDRGGTFRWRQRTVTAHIWRVRA